MPATDKIAKVKVETAITQNPFSEYTEEQIKLVKQTVAQDCNDIELAFFLHNARRFGLDPVAKQIYAIKRKGRMTIQTSIDGMRLIADRTKGYAPGSKTEYEYEEVLTHGGEKKRVLFAATAYVKKFAGGEWHEVAETAHWAEYVQVFYDKETRKDKVGDMWIKMPLVMLAKCAEARALRRAFPAELGGLYETSEMTQAENTYDPTNTERDLSHLAPGEENRGHGKEGMKAEQKKTTPKKSAKKETTIEGKVMPITKSAEAVAAMVNAAVGGNTTTVGTKSPQPASSPVETTSLESHTIHFMHKNIKPLIKKLDDGGERRYLAITAASDLVYYCWHESLHEHLGRAASTDNRTGQPVTCLCREKTIPKTGETVYAIENVTQIGSQLFKDNQPYNAEMEDDIASFTGQNRDEEESPEGAAN